MKIRITAAPLHFYIQNLHTVAENLAVAAPPRVLTGPLQANIGDSIGGGSLSGKSLPAPALLTDISNKRFLLCNLGEELSICPPLKAGLEQSKPFHLGSSVWTHRHTEANRGAEAQRAPVNTTFPSSHTHAKRWDGLNTLCSERPFILAILGQSKQHHMAPQSGFFWLFIFGKH